MTESTQQQQQQQQEQDQPQQTYTLINPKLLVSTVVVVDNDNNDSSSGAIDEKDKTSTTMTTMTTKKSNNSNISYIDLCNSISTLTTIWVSQQLQIEPLIKLSSSSNNNSSSNDKTSLLIKTTSSTTPSSTITNSYIIDGYMNSYCMAYTLMNSITTSTTSSTSTNNNPFKYISSTQQCSIDNYCEYIHNTILTGIYNDIIIVQCHVGNNNMNIDTIKSRLSTLCKRIEDAIGQSGNYSNYYIINNTLTVVDIMFTTTIYHFVQYYYYYTYYNNNMDNDNNKNHNNDNIDNINILITKLFSLPIQQYLKFHVTNYYNAYMYCCVEKQKNELSIITTTNKDSNNNNTIDTIMKETSIMYVVDTVFRSVIQQVLMESLSLDISAISLPKIIVKPCSNPKHGDYQFSAAMPIYSSIMKYCKEHNITTNNSVYTGPMDIANAIVKQIGNNHAIITDVSTQGPGFILCRISNDYLQYHINQYLHTNQLSMPKSILTNYNESSENSNQKICVVDFSSPNIAKEMHVGHLRSTIIGECICRILEQTHHIVHRINHVGDWGTQFGMLIQYLKEEYPNVVHATNMNNSTNNSTTEDTSTTSSSINNDLPNITDLTTFYKNAKQRFDESSEFKKISQLNVVKLQSGDVECMNIWKLLCDISRKEFYKVYQRLDVSCIECGESFYNDKISDVIDEFTKANYIQIEDGGAKCVFVPKYTVPLMLQKSDGGYGYDSTDMAALKYRLQVLKANRIIYITDFTQGDHFKMVFQAGEMIGWIQNGQQLQHIGFGTVQGEDGKRFKTRSGDTVRLVDLLDEAVDRMEQELRQRIADGKANITLDEVHEVAEAIGYGAVKYFDLRRNPTSNYKFSYDQMLDTKGDTAVYLLYTRVRLESIISKAEIEYNINIDELKQNGTQIEITHVTERNLILQLLNFTDIMELTLDDLYPYHICEYIYKVATVASDFVTQCRVLGSDEMKSRILLCHVTTNAMHYCFDLLGIRHVKRI